MTIVSGEAISRSIAGFGYTELALSALLIDLVEPGDFMIDIGAHFGYVSLLGSRLVGSSGRVLGFEPNPRSFSIAQRNLAPFPQAEVRQMAVLDRKGSVSLEDRPIQDSAFNSIVSGASKVNSPTVDVPAISLDEILSERSRPLDLLKCDAEGAEEKVLRGAAGIIEEDRPFVVLEVGMEGEGYGRRLEEIKVTAEDAGYEVRDFEYKGSLEVVEVERGEGKYSGHANLLMVPKETSRY
ncbi:FkbM family methyltransferase [Salinibacter ruber]|uniref:FkbM family methyltransferase n=1 Tax=Salinibacter ruber TaxID=146919 RepID=UPI0021672265|nr:FkbM family methyltransferase [Salinibacter ruber]MCS4136389.1 FkbM family methyltransferase [Salinibacter ruber]